jgi:hypothetical protein
MSRAPVCDNDESQQFSNSPSTTAAGIRLGGNAADTSSGARGKEHDHLCNNFATIACFTTDYFDNRFFRTAS